MSSVYAVSGSSAALDRFARVDPRSERLAATGATGFPSGVLPSGLTSRSANPSVLSVEGGRELVSRSVDAANDILDKLYALQRTAQTAQDEGYLNGVPELSRLTLQADTRELLAGIDDAVAAATVGSANVVSSSGRDARISTTTLGGALTVAVQALDTRALGLRGLDLTSDAGVQDALSRVAAAVADAGVKAQRLNGLGRAVENGGDFFSAVQTTLAALSGGTAYGGSGYGASGKAVSQPSARGSVVNFLA